MVTSVSTRQVCTLTSNSKTACTTKGSGILGSARDIQTR